MLAVLLDIELSKNADVILLTVGPSVNHVLVSRSQHHDQLLIADSETPVADESDLGQRI